LKLLVKFKASFEPILLKAGLKVLLNITFSETIGMFNVVVDVVVEVVEVVVVDGVVFVVEVEGRDVVGDEDKVVDGVVFVVEVEGRDVVGDEDKVVDVAVDIMVDVDVVELKFGLGLEVVLF
jgi:hypothetical protein